MESILLCIQIVLFHLSERFSYLNTPWSQHVQTSDFQLYSIGSLLTVAAIQLRPYQSSVAVYFSIQQSCTLH